MNIHPFAVPPGLVDILDVLPYTPCPVWLGNFTMRRYPVSALPTDSRPDCWRRCSTVIHSTRSQEVGMGWPEAFVTAVTALVVGWMIVRVWNG